jgi:hypothetical protein
MSEIQRKNIEETEYFLKTESFLKQVKESMPGKEILPIEKANFYGDDKLGEALRYFRNNVGQRTVEICAGGITGEFVFNPQLWSRADTDDEDYGKHRADSTGNISYSVNYVLSDANFGETLGELKEQLDLLIEELRKPNFRVDLFTHHADWMDANTYQKEMMKIKKLSPQEREEISVNKNDRRFNMLMERIENANFELNGLLKELPVENYGAIDEEGDIEWFGLPVLRESVMEIKKTFQNSGRVVEGEKIGVSNFKIDLFKTKLAAWLDQYGDALQNIIEQKEEVGLPEKIDIKKLDIPLNKYIDQLAQELGIAMKTHFGDDLGWVYDAGKDVLNLEVALRGDYRGLKVRVANINDGMGEIADPEKVADTIKEKGFILNDNAGKKMIEALDAEKLHGIRRVKGKDQTGDGKTEMEIKRFGGQNGKKTKAKKPDAIKEAIKSSELPRDIFDEIEEIFSLVNLDNYYKFGVFRSDFEAIETQIRQFKETLGKENQKERDGLAALRNTLREMKNYNQRREESLKVVDEAIEKYYGKCPICGVKLVDDSCKKKHDIGRFDFEINDNNNRVGPLILSEIKTDKGLIVSRMMVSDDYDRSRKLGEIYLLFDRDTGDNGWNFKPFEKLEYIDYEKILPFKESKDKKKN